MIFSLFMTMPADAAFVPRPPISTYGGAFLSDEPASDYHAVQPNEFVRARIHLDEYEYDYPPNTRKSISAAPSFEEYMRQRATGSLTIKKQQDS
jgi:hypothetical protein